MQVPCLSGPTRTPLITAHKRSLGQGNMFTGVCLSTGVSSRGGVPGPRGGACCRGVPGGDPPTATAAGGTHPTGMHSCFV